MVGDLQEELNKPMMAVHAHTNDLRLSEAKGLNADVYRAAGNLGRLYQGKGDCGMAASMFRKQVDVSTHGGFEGCTEMLGRVFFNLSLSLLQVLQYDEVSAARSVFV